MKMKKIFAGFAMTTVAATLLAGNVFATQLGPKATGQEENDELGTGITDVVKEVEEGFTWAVPAELDIDGVNSGDISVSGARISSSNIIKISLTDGSNCGAGNALKLRNGAALVGYTLTGSSVGSIVKGSDVLTISSGTASGSETITATTAETFTVAGDYSDSLTFTAVITSAD